MAKRQLAHRRYFSLLLFLTLGLPSANSAFAQGTAFTYQGKLIDAGNPATGPYDLQFRLFDALVGGNQVGSTVISEDVPVASGIFSVTLDFLAAAFPGADRWLEIGVRPGASTGAFTMLSPLQPLTSAPYAVQSLNATNATTADNANKLGNIDASEYVTTTSAGNTFIKNDTTQQTGANFNISGNGIFGGNVGIGITPFAGVKLDVNGDTLIRTSGSGGNIQFGTPSAETGMTIIGTNRADVRFDGSTLKLVTIAGPGVPGSANGIAINTAGNVGIGITPFAGAKLDVNGDTLIRTSGSGGNIQFGTPGAETGMTVIGANRADVRFDGSKLKLLAGVGTGVPASTNGIAINTSGNVGIGTGTTTPAHRLDIVGGPLWTSNSFTGAIAMNSGSAIGWRANPGGQRFGIAPATGGLYFFRTASDPGTTGSPVSFDLELTDTGNLTQSINNNGLVKAMISINVFGSITKCYNGITNTSAGNCGFTITVPIDGVTRINFGFLVSSRFVSVTAEYEATINNTNNSGANYRFFDSTSVEVFTFAAGNSADTSSRPFTLIMY